MSSPINNIQELRAADHRGDRRIGKILCESGRISPEDIENILHLQKERNLRFGEAAKQLGLITDDDIHQILSDQFDYPYLIPGDSRLSDELIAAYMPFSESVEALRVVRSQLMLRWFTDQRKALAVIAAGNGSGTSYVAANLAVVCSQLGEHTLLIDANLRSPRQHRIFKLSNREGLSDMLSGRADSNAIEQPDGLSHLSILGAGTIPPNPQELLGRAAFDRMLLAFTSQFDIVLVDTVPNVDAADAQIVAARCQGALMVVRPNHTRMADSVKLRDQTLSAGAQIVGAVINKF